MGNTAITALRSLLFINVKDYGAVGNGVANDTAAITAAINAANAAGGGVVFFPAGTYMTNTQTLYSNVHILGAGIGITRIKLNAGLNTDLFNGGATNISYITLGGAYGTGNTGGLNAWSIRDITLDANKAQNTAGYALRVYGLTYHLDTVEFCNGYSGGVQLDWNGGDPQPGPECEAFIGNCRFYDNYGFGLEFGGPHDSTIVNCLFMHASSALIHLGPNAAGATLANHHGWAIQQATNSTIFLIEAAKVTMYNCVAESSDAVNVVILGDDCIWEGYVYGSGTAPGIGMQLGQIAGQTPFLGQLFQSAGVSTAVSVARSVIGGKFALNSSSMKFANETASSIDVNSQSSGATFVGTPDPSSVVKSNFFQGSAQSPAAIAIATGGTISTSLSISRVSPTANVTGVILAPGGVPGQHITVVNESAFSLTCAAVTTSHVADGISAVIAANLKMDFTWDSAVSKWYHS